MRDLDAFTKAGKVGIGGIAVTEDGSTLFFVNLFDKNLYALDIAEGATPTSATQIPLDLGADQRPWAVAVHRDRVYVGYVDTGGDGAVPGNRGHRELLRRLPASCRRCRWRHRLAE